MVRTFGPVCCRAVRRCAIKRSHWSRLSDNPSRCLKRILSSTRGCCPEPRALRAWFSGRGVNSPPMQQPMGIRNSSLSHSSIIGTVPGGFGRQRCHPTNGDNPRTKRSKLHPTEPEFRNWQNPNWRAQCTSLECAEHWSHWLKLSESLQGRLPPGAFTRMQLLRGKSGEIGCGPCSPRQR
jgi:hypothetical protein